MTDCICGHIAEVHPSGERCSTMIYTNFGAMSCGCPEYLPKSVA